MYSIRFLQTGLIPVLCTLLTAPAALAQTVRAYFEQDTIYPGDTATLTIEADGQLQNQHIEPDLAPLNRDFEVLGSSSVSQLRIINGQRSQTLQWRIGLAPKTEGPLSVPALQVGSARTEPLALTVTPMPPEMARRQAQHIFIQSEAAAGATPYVQSQIVYTVRLLYDTPLRDGELSEPKPVAAVVERLGEDHSYTRTIAGRRYGVLERRYAIFPEKSGEFTIPAVRFSGHMAAAADTQRRRSLPGSSAFSSQFDAIFRRMLNDPLFDSMPGPSGAQSQQVSVGGQPLTLTVAPRAAGYDGNYWLPAEELTLRETWSPEAPRFRVGEPLSRTISIDAKGLAASYLPALTLPELNPISVYPEQPVIENRNDGKSVYGHREQRMTIVPTAPGSLTLPAIELSWWDSKNERQQLASLPARTVEVLPAGAVSANSPAAGDPRRSPATTAAANQHQPAAAKPPAATVVSNGESAVLLSADLWPWAAAAVLLLLLWPGTLLIRRRGRHITVSAEPADRKPATPAAARQALRRACSADNPQAAAAALLDWAAGLWPQSAPVSLGALAARLRAEQGDAVRRLDQVLYAGGDQHWQGVLLWQVMAAGPLAKTAVNSYPGRRLPPLYPRADT